jgi:hypothetical protein
VAIKRSIHICGDTPCPNDEQFIHRFYYGCTPKDFKENTGTSATYKQTKGDDGKYRWGGGCDK